MNTHLILPFAVDLLLKSSAVFVFTWLALQVWRRTSAAQRGCIWCVALASIALLPFTRLVAPHWALSFSKASAPVEPMPAVGPSELPAIIPDEIVSTPPIQTWEMPNGAAMGVGIWLAGIFLLVAYRLAGAFLVHRCRLSSFPLQDDAGGNKAVSMAADLGIARPVDVLVSRGCQVPVTWGTWRPVVMLPAEALDWPREWLESALRHEMGHVKNYDHLKRLVAFLTCAFYWPNPLVWAAAKQLQLAQEEASDNLVLRVGVSPRDYAAQLIELIRLNAGRGVLSIPAVAMAHPSTLEGRLSAILDDTRNRAGADGRLVLASTGLVVVLGLALGAIQLRAAEPAVIAQESPLAPKPLTQPAADKPVVDPAGSILDQKLKAIVLSVDFNNATLAEATNFLSIESKSLDPEHQGVSFIIESQASMSAKPISLTLANVSLGEALGYVCKLAHVKFKVEDKVIAVVAFTQDNGGSLYPDPTVEPAGQSGQAIAHKLKSIVIDKVNFNNLDVATILQFLAFKSKELDPDKKGINFVLGNITPQDHVHRAVSVVLDNVPMDEFLGYVAQQTNLKWSIEANAVYFAPAGNPSPEKTLSTPSAPSEPTQPGASTSQGSPRIQFAGYQRLNGDYIFRLYFKGVAGYVQPPIKKSGDNLGFENYTIGDFHQIVKDRIDPVTQATVKADESTLDLVRPQKGNVIALPVGKEVELPE